MERTVWITGSMAMLGAAVLVGLCRWIVISDSTRWARSCPRYSRHVDQRWAIPIAAFVDLIYASVGLSTDADTAFWIFMAVVLGLQVALITAALAAVRGRMKRADG